MPHDARLVLLVGHDDSTRARLSVRARLLGLEPVECITGARAVELATARRPLAVISELILPGGDGLVSLAEIERRWPGVNTVLLSTIPPGLSAPDRARYAVDHVLARRGAWEPAVMQAAFPGLEPPAEAAALWRALDGEDPDPVAALLDAGGLPPDLESLALEHFAATRPAEEVLPVLERILDRPDASGRAARFETALDLGVAQGAAGFEVARRVASEALAPPAVRARAVRWLAERFELPAIVPILTPLARGPAALWQDASQALFEAAAAAGHEGQEVLRVLAEGEAVPDRVRARAVEALVKEHPRAEVREILSRLSHDPSAGMRDLVSRHLAATDEFELDRLREQAEAGSAPVEQRMAGLSEAAAQLPAAAALPLFERAQLDPQPRLRALAFELAFSRAERGFEPSLARAIAAGPAFVQSALLGAMKLGRRGADAVTAIALAPEAPAGTRRKALRLLGLRFSPEQVVPTLRGVLEGEGDELASAAILAAVQLGRPGWGLLYSALSSKAPASTRSRALDALERHAPAELVQVALRRASRDPDPGLRAVAVRVAARQAGADLAPLISGIHEAGQPALFDAAVEGAASLGLSGFVGLARLALADEVPIPARRAAWRALEAGFEAEALAPVRARLERAAPEVLSPPEPARPAVPIASSRPSAAVAWDESAPARAAVARAPQRPPQVEGWEVADTAPARPATDPEAETVLDSARVRPAKAPPPASEARTQPARPAAPPPEATRPDPPAEPTRPTKPAIPPPEAPTLVDRPWGEAVPRGTSGIREPEPAPARPAPPPPRAPSPPPRPAPVATEAVTILPSGPAAPRPRPRRAQVSLPRARKALQAALQLGQDGFRGLRTLADSTRVPSEVRIQALRHLAADFGKRAITPIFERALGSDDPAIQNTALSCVMIQRQVALAPVAALAGRPDAEVATRVRAMRFISSRYPKQKTRELFEALLTAEAPELRKTALESIFTSMRFVAPDQIEQALINLLKEHDDFDVRVSAAKALGAFGGPDAQAALRSAAGFFGHDALKDAAREALERLEN